MKTKLIIEVQTRDNIKAMIETGEEEKPSEEVDMTKECHNDFVGCIERFLENMVDELPDDFEDGYIEGMDEPVDYGFIFTIKTVAQKSTTPKKAGHNRNKKKG